MFSGHRGSETALAYTGNELRNSTALESDESDFRLLERIQDGEGDAFAVLYDRWVDRVYSVATHIVGNAADAEEVVGRTFLRVWREADTYSRARGSIGAWIVLAGRSEALTQLRGKAGETG